MDLIRLTRICWLCRLFDEVIQCVSQLLCKDDIHSQPGANSSLRGLTGVVDDRFGHGQVNDFVSDTVLDDHARDARGNTHRVGEPNINVANTDLFVQNSVSYDNDYYKSLAQQLNNNWGEIPGQEHYSNFETLNQSLPSDQWMRPYRKREGGND